MWSGTTTHPEPTQTNISKLTQTVNMSTPRRAKRRADENLQRPRLQHGARTMLVGCPRIIADQIHATSSLQKWQATPQAFEKMLERRSTQASNRVGSPRRIADQAHGEFALTKTTDDASGVRAGTPQAMHGWRASEKRTKFVAANFEQQKSIQRKGSRRINKGAHRCSSCPHAALPIPRRSTARGRARSLPPDCGGWLIAFASISGVSTVPVAMLLEIKKAHMIL